MTQPALPYSFSEQRLNEQLRLSEERFRVMVAAAAKGIVAADLRLRLTKANRE